MIGCFIIKVAIEIIFTPVTYWVVRKLKHIEQEDYYDYKTNFNPFNLRAETPPTFSKERLTP